MTTLETYNNFLMQLQSIYEKTEATAITGWVFENITQLKKWEIRENQKDISDAQALQLQQSLRELLKHKPVQYVLKEAWFYKKKFYVNMDVLIPRAETEELVTWIIDDIKSIAINKEPYTCTLLDVGTGSGCIAISLKDQLPHIDITAIDVSKKALAVAGKNSIEFNTVINFIHGDFLNESVWHTLDKYNVIVSNPPYIPEKEKASLSKNVIAFEPAMALFVPDNSSFIFYEKMAQFAQTHLEAKGKLYVEIHENYANKILRIFKYYNFKTEIKKDIYGKERMIKAEK